MARIPLHGWMQAQKSKDTNWEEKGEKRDEVREAMVGAMVGAMEFRRMMAHREVPVIICNASVPSSLSSSRSALIR